jgi:hypothetical protein
VQGRDVLVHPREHVHLRAIGTAEHPAGQVDASDPHSHELIMPEPTTSTLCTASCAPSARIWRGNEVAVEAHRGHSSQMVGAREWLFQRSVARVEVGVEEIVADFATSYVGRPVQRRNIPPPRPVPGIAWSVDGKLLVEFLHRESGPDELLIHEVALLDVLERRFRTRHVRVAYVTTTWGC